jgi:hypothetical protein
MCNCDGSDARGNVQTPATMAGGLTRSVSASPALDKLTLDKVRDGHVKYKNLKKDQLKELCATLLGHIEDLKLGLEKAKAPHNVSTTNETFELRAELKELKEAVFVNESGTNAMGDKPVGLTQAYWDTRNRRVIPWDVINRLAAEEVPPSETPNGEDNVNRVVKVVNATSVKEGNPKATSSEAKSAKLAKLVKLAKSRALWCLLRCIPLSQEAKDMQRKVCPVNLQGEVCTALPTTAAASNLRSASWPTTARGRSPNPRARCGTCGSCLRANPRETSLGGGAAPSLPPAARGTTAAMPGRPSQTSTSSSSRWSTVPRSSRGGSGRRR